MKTLRLTLPILYMSVILMLSSIPGNSSPSADQARPLDFISPWLQNLLHLPLYGGLLLAWLWAMAPVANRPGQGMPIACGISAGFAVVDEVFQSTVPGRTMSAMDVGANITGVFLACLGFWMWQALRRKLQ